MARTSKKSLRRQRKHGVLPAGFKWRQGRPRWEPSPKRRGQGWRGHDLKDAKGVWLPLGAAIDKAGAIADAARAWAQGAAVPIAVAHLAPTGAVAAGLSPDSPRCIGAMLDKYEASVQFQGNGTTIKGLGARTQADYRGKLRRFVLILAGDDPDKVPGVRALDMDALLPPAFGEKGVFFIEKAYDDLREAAGEHMAHGVLAAVSAWMTWCVQKERLWPTNPAQLVKRSTPEGRIVLWEPEELVAMVRMAEAMDRTSIADAIILAVDLSWIPQDILSLVWPQISADFHVKHRRIKTGNAGNPRLLKKIGEKRVEEIRARWSDNVQPTHVLMCEKTGRPWGSDSFRDEFALVRAAVAEQFPAVADKQFRDLRDTAITICYRAGLNIPQICSRTLHDPTRAQAIIQKHYGAIPQDISDDAADRLDAHHERTGFTFDDPLALPAPAADEGQRA